MIYELSNGEEKEPGLKFSSLYYKIKGMKRKNPSIRLCIWKIDCRSVSN